MTTPNKMETLKKDMIVLNEIIEENWLGGKQFRKCVKCNQQTLGHDPPGYGVNRCVNEDVVTGDDSLKLFNEIFTARENKKINELFHCNKCGLDLVVEKNLKDHI